ncbi:MAG: flippase-like domain-containing protein [Chloroflexi bacterium]|nr:flippase-like domain-containing protein [Chloroflexota bacterium]
MKRWQFWIGVLISITFLYAALNGLELSDFWEKVQGANYWWIIPGVLVYFMAVWARSWRWHYMLRPLKDIPTKAMFPIVTIGYMGNNVYPARAGEVLRAVVLKRREGVPISASLATIIVERVFDGVVMLSFVFLNLGELARFSGEAGLIGEVTIQDIALWSTVFFVIALVVFLTAAMFPSLTKQLLAWFFRFVPARYRDRGLALSSRFLDGLESLRSPKDALMIFITSLVIWLLETVKFWFVMQAFNFEVSFFTLMLVNGVANLATTIPSAPGYVGPFDAAIIAVLEGFSISTAQAAAYALVLHVALWLPITALGAICLGREGIKWGEIPQGEVSS